MKRMWVNISWLDFDKCIGIVSSVLEKVGRPLNCREPPAQRQTIRFGTKPVPANLWVSQCNEIRKDHRCRIGDCEYRKNVSILKEQLDRYIELSGCCFVLAYVQSYSSSTFGL